MRWFLAFAGGLSISITTALAQTASGKHPATVEKMKAAVVRTEGCVRVCRYKPRQIVTSPAQLMLGIGF